MPEVETTELQEPIQVGSRDFHRLHCYGQLMAELGLPAKYLDGMNPVEREKTIEGVVRQVKESRSDEQIMTSEGVTVFLNNKEYEIKPLMFGEDIKFRKGLGKFIAGIFTRLEYKEGGSVDDFMKKIMPMVFTDMLDGVVELMFQYSPELRKDKKEIMEGTTSFQMADSAMRFFRFVFPFVSALLLQMVDVGQRMGMAE